MKKALKRLHLRQGDILVVSDAETLNRLKRCGAQPPPGVKSIPVVLAPEGIERVPLEKLKELVARLEKEKSDGKEKEGTRVNRGTTGNIE